MRPPKKKKTTQGPRKYGELSDEEIQRRWRGLMPMFIKCLVGCMAVAVGTFFLNRLWHPDQRSVDIMNVIFQITSAGSVLFAFLTLMALLYGKKSPPRS